MTGEDSLSVSGSKKFCSGAGLIDHALVTVGNPKQLLIDVDLRKSKSAPQFDNTDWKAGAFKETQTATVSFKNVPITKPESLEPKVGI